MTLKTNNTLQNCIQHKDISITTIRILCKTTLSIMALGIITISKRTLRITIFCRTILSIEMPRMRTLRMTTNFSLTSPRHSV